MNDKVEFTTNILIGKFQSYRLNVYRHSIGRLDIEICKQTYTRMYNKIWTYNNVFISFYTYNKVFYQLHW